MLTPILNILKNRNPDVENWLNRQWDQLKPQLYLSCDIRHAGYKISVVDANIFPAGFNNLCSSFLRDTAHAFKDYLKTYFPKVKKILIYGEEHTRNKYYLKNLLSLQTLLEKGGFEVKCGVLGEYLPSPQLKVDFENSFLILEKLERNENRVTCQNFEPDLVISNNDFSNGVPELLQNIDQPLIPSAELGWHRRTKILHFNVLNEIISNFASHFGFDPWLLSPLTESIPQIDFDDRHSLEQAASQIDALIQKIQQKYNEYHLTDSPYIYLKNNTGTYGMGLITLSSGFELFELNRKKRIKLLSTKADTPIHSYLIQEGIPTIDTYSGYPLEPVIYMVGQKDIGGFFRIHESKNELESLNAPGMTFSCLCLHKLNEPHEDFFLDCRKKEAVVILSRFLARLSALAIAKEAKILEAGY